MSALSPLRVVVLISGGGSNLQALIDDAQHRTAFQIVAVVSNRADAYGLQRAALADIQTKVLDHRDYPDRQTYDSALQQLIDRFTPELVVLAGFMRILTLQFVSHYRGRLLNIHPSLLPKFRGLHTHQRALDAGETVHGASVHFVTEELDGGPVILQSQVPVQPGDDAERLAARVLEQEHRIYPQVVNWFAEKRLYMGKDGEIRLNQKILSQPAMMPPAEP